MRKYSRPMMLSESFDIEDVITDSSNQSGAIDWGDEIESSIVIHIPEAVVDASAESANAAPAAPKAAPKMEVFGSVDAEGYFTQEITGGNVVQEGLNNLYENFLSKF